MEKVVSEQGQAFWRKTKTAVIVIFWISVICLCVGLWIPEAKAASSREEILRCGLYEITERAQNECDSGMILFIADTSDRGTDYCKVDAIKTKTGYSTTPYLRHKEEICTN